MSRRGLLALALGLAAATSLVVIPITAANTVTECPPWSHGRALPPGLLRKCLRVAAAPTTTAPSTTVTPTTTTTAARATTLPTPTTTTRTTTTTLASRTTGPLNLPRVPWEGGPAYYKQWASTDTAGWDDPGFFPIGLFFEGVDNVQQVRDDMAAGINAYFEVTDNTDLSAVREAGMWAWPSNLEGGLTGKMGSETIGSTVYDEADMEYGPGWADWSGKLGWGTCIPQDKGCGYTVSKALREKLPAGKPEWANYGKGVMFWETPDEAQVFVNQFQDVASVDIYHYTDDASCTGVSANVYIRGSGKIDPYAGVPQLTPTECHRAWNYGATMDKLRDLDVMDGKLQPLYNFIETGSPFDNGADGQVANDMAITAPQLAGAVMSSLIHEARGILYFGHNFGGPCNTGHALRDCPDQAAAVKVINDKIKSLAPVLNTQSLQHSFGPGVDTMLKWLDGAYYVFAMQEEPGYKGAPTASTRTFTLPAGMAASKVDVLFESRSIPVDGGRFTDRFAAEHSFHIYKITT